MKYPRYQQPEYFHQTDDVVLDYGSVNQDLAVADVPAVESGHQMLAVVN